MTLVMQTLLNLFARSPFSPLQDHMEQVSRCVYLLKELFDALQAGKFEKGQEIAKKISKLEHKADLIKNDIRNHLPSGLYLPIDRGDLLEILALQDCLADQAEDIAILTTFKNIQIPESFQEVFSDFLGKNLEAFDQVAKIIRKLHKLLGSSFGGAEAEKVRKLVDEVSFYEHQGDLLQRKLMKKLYQDEVEMTHSSFSLLQHMFQAISALSNISEKLAHRIRMTLDVR